MICEKDCAFRHSGECGVLTQVLKDCPFYKTEKQDLLDRIHSAKLLKASGDMYRIMRYYGTVEEFEKILRKDMDKLENIG